MYFDLLMVTQIYMHANPKLCTPNWYTALCHVDTTQYEGKWTISGPELEWEAEGSAGVGCTSVSCS